MAKNFNLYAFSSKDMLTSRSDDYRRDKRNPKKYQKRNTGNTIIHIKQNLNADNSKTSRG